MSSADDVAYLRAKLEQRERDEIRFSWLLRKLVRKVGNTPRDLIRRLRRSVRKRLGMPAQPAHAFQVYRGYRRLLNNVSTSDELSRSVLSEIRAFRFSEEMKDLVSKAAALEPEIGSLDHEPQSFLPPWHDADFSQIRKATDAIPRGRYDAVVLMPAGRMGGADLIAGMLAQALSQQGRTLILRTDDKQWDQPHWYPDDVVTIDISEALGRVTDHRRALYTILCEIAAPRIFNVNSRRAFDTFVAHGNRLAAQFKLHAYYFCSDRTPDGIETGYPVWFFSNLLPYLTTAITDSADLRHTLVERHGVPRTDAARVKTIYTPSRVAIRDVPLAVEQLARAKHQRPCLLWAGRIDRQKRFDLALDIARAMPDVDFRAWGKAVLDTPPDLRHLPPNFELNAPFVNYEELPLADCDGWLYTSAWDGLPTILIDLGALGMPVVACAVGGVPELIDETTGWPVDEEAGVAGMVQAIRDMLASADSRVVRGRALQERVRERHSIADYVKQIANL